MDALVALFRVSVVVVWLLSPPILAVIALRGWARSKRPDGRRAILPLAIGTAILTNWILFVVLLGKSLTAYYSVYPVSRLTDILLFLSLLALVASITVSVSRWKLLLANALLVSLWVGVAYGQTHWLTRVDFGTVRVDEHSVPAVVYIGNPRQSEAEAIALVHVPNVGDYFLDFGEETFRHASAHEFIPLHYGAWTWKPMIHGQFRPPLPFRNVNECRIPLPDGRVVTVTF